LGLALSGEAAAETIKSFLVLFSRKNILPWPSLNCAPSAVVARNQRGQYGVVTLREG
jgi:hypothetical protein